MMKTDPSKKVTQMTKEICDKYMKQIWAEVHAKDDEIEDVDPELKFIELGDTLPETAKPNLLEFIHRKLDEVNQMEIPNSVNKHL